MTRSSGLFSVLALFSVSRAESWISRFSVLFVFPRRSPSPEVAAATGKLTRYLFPASVEVPGIPPRLMVFGNSWLVALPVAGLAMNFPPH